jgi:hypothetical protein
VNATPIHPFLLTVQQEARRLGLFNCSVEHLEGVLSAEAGSEEFDQRLEDFCASGRLTFEPIDEHLAFRPIPKPPDNVLLEARARRARAEAVPAPDDDE